MAAAPVRRRGHPACATCKLPVAVRSEVARLARRGESMSSISRYVVNEGHGIGRDGVGRHVRQCLGVAESDGSDPVTRSVLLAQIVAGLLPGGWAGRLDLIAHSANESGLTTEALVLQSHVPETMREALAATDGTPAAELLAARALALACGRILKVAHPEAARDIAADLRRQGVDELADDLLWLANRATKDRQPEGSAAGSAPLAAANERTTA
jgi:hypothetical protein